MSQFYSDLQEAVSQCIRERQLKHNTARSYRVELRRFVDWTVAEKKLTAFREFESLHLSEFLGWVVQLRAQKVKTPSSSFTVNVASLEQTRRIVKAFLQWLAMEKRLVPSSSWSGDYEIPSQMRIPSSGVAKSRKSLSYMTKEVCEVLLAQHDPISFGEIRDALMANLAFWCCATTSELAAMRAHHLDIRRHRIELDANTENTRQVSIPQHLYTLARDYLSLRKKQIRDSGDHHGYLFVNDGSMQALQPWTIRRRVSTTCGTSSSYGPTPQKLRRAFLHLCEPLSICSMETAYRSGNQLLTLRAGEHDIDHQSLDLVVSALRTQRHNSAITVG